MQILNIVLFWLFFGFLSSYLARKRGRNERLWFCLGLLLGIIGVAIIALLPKVTTKKTTRSKPVVEILPPLLPKNRELDKVWFYLDQNNQQVGPFYFPAFFSAWKKQNMGLESYVWAEGMSEWKKIKELPDLLQEFQQ